MLKRVPPKVQNIQVKKKYEQEVVGRIAYFPITQATSNNSTAVFFWFHRNMFAKTLSSNDGWIHMPLATQNKMQPTILLLRVFVIMEICLLSQCLAVVRGHTHKHTDKSDVTILPFKNRESWVKKLINESPLIETYTLEPDP
jgi:hypothetical protein